MLTLLFRAVILYILVFACIRLTGKRQVSDLQPFDLVVTLLVADLVSDPITDNSIPLLYGVVPICTLFLLQRLVTFLAIKSENARRVLCGSPLVVIERGKICEDVMRAAHYTVSDLLEQLRDKDVFDLSQVEFAILETSGRINVLLQEQAQQPTRGDLHLPAGDDCPAAVLISDGQIQQGALKSAGRSSAWLEKQLRLQGIGTPEQVFFASLSPDGTLFVQEKQIRGARVYRISGGQENG